MGKSPKNSMQAHTQRQAVGLHESGVKLPRSSPKPGGYLVHPTAAGKVGAVPVKPNPGGKKR